LPFLTYSAPGGLRQDRGRTAESSAEATTCGHEGVRVLLSTYEGRGDVEPLVGLGGAGSGARGGGADVRATRLRGAAGRIVRGKATRDEAPVIRSAGALRRSTAASEVSQ